MLKQQQSKKDVVVSVESLDANQGSHELSSFKPNEKG